MANVPAKQTTGPYTFPILENIARGQLVEGRAHGVGVAGAASTNVVGVALTTGTFGDPQAGAPAGTIVVAYRDAYIVVGNNVRAKVTYSSAAVFGDPLVATATGQVAPAGSTPDARTVIGRCAEPEGVGSAAVGTAFIYV